MKLFIWDQPWRVKYGTSCLIVVAEDHTQARIYALTEMKCKLGSEAPTEIGPPDEVISCPGSTSREWSE